VVDIRDLISVDDVMEDDVLQMGPNGGLIFCMEFVFSESLSFSWIFTCMRSLKMLSRIHILVLTGHFTSKPFHAVNYYYSASFSSPAVVAR